MVGQQSQTIDHEIYSKKLSENRPVNIYLPADYTADSSSFGVLYVLDGEYVFEFAKGAVAFLSNAFGYMPPLIVVGIPNIDRGRDMTVRFDESDRYEGFLGFLENELVPYINSNFRTNGFDILYGWSSASNINMQLLARRPNLFDAHIQSGTGIGNKTATFLTEHLSNNEFANSFLYANVEGSGPRLKGLENYQRLIETLSPKGLKYKFEVLKSSSHVNVLAEGIYNGLQFVFEDFYIPDSITVTGLEAIKKYYSGLSSKYDYNVNIPIGAFVESAGILLQHQKSEAAIDLLQYGMQCHPTSHDIIGSLGEVYEYLEDFEAAARHYHLASQISPKPSVARQKYLHLSDQVKAKN